MRTDLIIRESLLLSTEEKVELDNDHLVTITVQPNSGRYISEGRRGGRTGQSQSPVASYRREMITTQSRNQTTS